MLSTLHPIAKLAVCLVWLAASILVFNAAFQLATIGLALFALIVLERKPPLQILLLMVPFALFGFGFLTTSLLFRQESDFALRMARETPFSTSALSAGIVLFLRAIACGMVSALFVLTTDPGAFVKALMVNLRLSPRIGYSLLSALQLVPDLAAETQQIRLARAMKRGGTPARIPGPIELASLIVPLLAYAIRRASRAAIAMEARGLGSGQPRTIFGAMTWRRRDSVFILLAAAIVGITMVFTTAEHPQAALLSLI